MVISTQVVAIRTKGKNLCSFEFLSYLLVYSLFVNQDNFITIGHSGVGIEGGGEWKRCTYYDCNKSSREFAIVKHCYLNGEFASLSQGV